MLKSYHHLTQDQIMHFTVEPAYLKECEWRFNNGTPKQLLSDLKKLLREHYWVSAPYFLMFGWGARIRTWAWRDQNPLPYRLATPQYAQLK
jgi:hypothetical protein